MENEKEDAYKGYDVDGDLLVNHDVHIGGESITHGKASFKDAVRIEGVLFAKNIDSCNKGLFDSLDALSMAYPNPSDGWWAVVGIGYPGNIHKVKNGEWYDTGVTGGCEDSLGANIAEFKESVEIELSKIRNAVFKTKIDLGKDLRDTEEYTGMDLKITLRWNISKEGLGAVIPDSVIISKRDDNGTDVLYQTTPKSSSGKYETVFSYFGKTTFIFSAVVDGVANTQSISVTQALPLFTGFAPLDFSLANVSQGSLTDKIIMNKKVYTSTVSFSETVETKNNTDYFYVCIPAPMILGKISLMGFGVPVVEKTGFYYINKTPHKYNIYRSVNPPVQGKYTFELTIKK